MCTTQIVETRRGKQQKQGTTHKQSQQKENDVWAKDLDLSYGLQRRQPGDDEFPFGPCVCAEGIFSSAHIRAGQPFHCPLNRRGETKGSGQLWASELAYHMMVRSSSLSNGPAHAELHVKKRLQNAAARDASHSNSTPASLPRGTTSFFCVCPQMWLQNKQRTAHFRASI